MSETPEQIADHVLIKRGLYYRPNGRGYTGLKSEAGLYPASYACDLEGVRAVPIADAEDFAPACWEETKLAHMRDALTAAQAEAEKLRGELVEARTTIRNLMNDLHAHKDALAQSEPKQ